MVLLPEPDRPVNHNTGAVELVPDSRGMESLLDAADQQMYVQKRAKRVSRA